MKLPAFSPLLRAGAVALALGVTAVSAMPAQAQSNSPSLSFSFQNGNGYGFSVGERHRPQRDCMSDREVRRLVERAGYRHVRIYASGDRYVRVRGDEGRRSYIVTVDACRGRIIDRDRVRR
ncbi:hypothetical protein [Devosia sp. 1566]|uniref:hypothetical protein n=1 Tax=Devosia sp. 1566 TaxID=2499144 RepID=UPI000FD9F756|nr:hypothetical protein [Devosia sp. 1566]